MKKIWTILKSTAIGAIKATPVVGNIATELKANLSDAPNEGKVNWPRMFGYLIMSVLVIGFIVGKVSFEDLEALLKLLLKHE